jgi:hypothetical protein
VSIIFVGGTNKKVTVHRELAEAKLPSLDMVQGEIDETRLRGNVVNKRGMQHRQSEG